MEYGALSPPLYR